VSPYIITRVLGIGHPNILHSDAQRNERTKETALRKLLRGYLAYKMSFVFHYEQIEEIWVMRRES